MKCQLLFIGKIRKIFNLPSADLAHRVVKVNFSDGVRFRYVRFCIKTQRLNTV